MRENSNTLAWSWSSTVDIIAQEGEIVNLAFLSPSHVFQQSGQAFCRLVTSHWGHVPRMEDLLADVRLYHHENWTIGEFAHKTDEEWVVLNDPYSEAMDENDRTEARIFVPVGWNSDHVPTRYCEFPRFMCVIQTYSRPRYLANFALWHLM